MMMSSNIKFDIPQSQPSIIKVLGVGGGGSNAVSHMYNTGITDVEFAICNTDLQALNASPVPQKIQIGVDLTNGLGAGADPEEGKQAAEESKEDIRNHLSEGTKMVFITAGMGGGTGTGAAPIVAEVAKGLGILTVGIVTLPFEFEGPKKMSVAEQGVKALQAHCDAVIVILNENILEVFDDIDDHEAFKEADNVLTQAAKSIAELITKTSANNLDFKDVKKILQGSGEAIIGSAGASGKDRALNAVQEAINSPLLRRQGIRHAKRILFHIAAKKGVKMSEIKQAANFVKDSAAQDLEEYIWGRGIDEALDEELQITILASEFEQEQEDVEDTKSHPSSLQEKTQPPAQPAEQVVSEKEEEALEQAFQKAYPQAVQKCQVTDLPSVDAVVSKEKNKAADTTAPSSIETLPETSATPVKSDPLTLKRKILKQQREERVAKLTGMIFKENETIDYKELQQTPAYKRRKEKFIHAPHSSDRSISKYHLNEKEGLGKNKFFNDRPD